MEINESKEHMLPSVEGARDNSDRESLSAMRMEQPVSSSPPASNPTPRLFPADDTAAAAFVDDPAYAMGGLPADDVDLIEKAWVEKAKAIVRSTHGDPYSQNRELHKIKAEYIKKRYSKDIKVSE